MNCPNCSSANPDVARFCHTCGSSLGDTRQRGYAASSAEGVGQAAVISTVMPHTSHRTADNYRWAMLISAVLILGATALGLLPIAIAAAAFLIPIAYLVYIYDVNLWEDTPVRVVAALFLVTGALAVAVSLFFFQWVFADEFAELLVGGRAGLGGIPIGGLLLFAVLLPLVAELVKNAGAIVLARRPQFDDMVDALTFGIAAGTAYAAFETLVLFWPAMTSGEFRTTDGLAGWVVIVLNLMVVKSLVYGTATGLAVAAFSGKGAGFDGFTLSYAKNFALAVGANILYWIGIRLLAGVPFGQALGLLWGAVILAVLLLRVRVVVQAALLEAAVEDAAKSGSPRGVTREVHCPECENMLLPGSRFCIACGASIRTSARSARAPMGEGGQAADPLPSGDLFKSSRNRTIALVLAGVVVVGALGAIGAAALGDDKSPTPTIKPGGVGLFDLEPEALPTPVPTPAPTPESGPSLRTPSEAEGDVVVIGDDIEIPVPKPWEVLVSDDNEALLGNGTGSFVSVLTGTTESTDAAALAVSAAQLMLPDSFYSDIEISQPEALPAAGSLVSIAAFTHSEIWSDQQSSQTFAGVMFVAIRQDGVILMIDASHTPAEEFSDHEDSFEPVVSGLLSGFAGAS